MCRGSKISVEGVAYMGTWSQSYVSTLTYSEGSSNGRCSGHARQQPTNSSSGGIPALQRNPGIFTTTGFSARLFPDLLVSSFNSTPRGYLARLAQYRTNRVCPRGVFIPLGAETQVLNGPSGGTCVSFQKAVRTLWQWHVVR